MMIRLVLVGKLAHWLPHCLEHENFTVPVYYILDEFVSGKLTLHHTEVLQTDIKSAVTF